MYEYQAKVVNIIDGDTIDCEVDLGFKIKAFLRFRLLNINTPEIHGVKKDSEEYVKGIRARNWMVENLLGKHVRIKTHKDKQGKYGRWLAEIFLNGININEELIREGLAERYNG